MSKNEGTIRFDCGDVSSLIAPHIRDPWGHERPPVSQDAMLLSVQLARAVYSLSLVPWLNAGWRDMTFQLNDRLTEGLENGTMGGLRRMGLQSQLNDPNVLAGLSAALKQKDKLETGKVLTMAHPAPNGRTVIAVSFMGTGKHLSDWVGNLRMDTEEGAHRGFTQLVRQFESNAEAITFQETAAQLGMEKLTLTDVLAECRRPDSRFVIWMSGHSQGAALLQLWCANRIAEGVLPQNMVGWGFASPSVVDSFEGEAADFPIYHVINSDDVVPRVGARIHLGMLLLYPADDALRDCAYNWKKDEKAEAARAALLPVVRTIHDTPSSILVSAAALRALKGMSPEDVLTVLNKLPESLHGWLKLMQYADNRIDELIEMAVQRIMKTYEADFGHAMPEDALAARTEELSQAIEAVGLNGVRQAMTELMLAPHSCGRENAAYPWIVENGIRRLLPGFWQDGVLHMLKRRDAPEPIRPHRIGRRKRTERTDNSQAARRPLRKRRVIE